MKTKLLGALAAVALLGACESASDSSSAATGTGAATGPRPGSQEHLATTAGDRVFFDFDRSNVRADAQETLSRQAQWLGQFPQANVQVQGNTDERGTREYNLALGQRRANAVREFLVARGVAGGRISTISFGKDRPIALGSDEGAWAQNRNALTVVQ